MKIGILTSSRADYGIYIPLLKVIQKDPFFEMHLLVFGAHMSEKFGRTIQQIEADDFGIRHTFLTSPENDTPVAIVRSMAKTMKLFAEFWEKHPFDLILALGDRYEMFSAVASSVPFNIPVAHIHGGETTLGAIDNVFRNSITAISKLHFTACEKYRERVIEIKGDDFGVHNVGALSIDNLASLQFLTIEEFYSEYKIGLNKPTILFTFHPETVNFDKNEEYIKTLIEVLKKLSQYQMVITMPNEDTGSNIIREYLNAFIEGHPNAFGIESFGSLGYLSCMKYCSFMLGNSSSGFVEASWFPKPVINVGDRQKGRVLTSNIKSCSIERDEIFNAIHAVENTEFSSTEKYYGEGKSADRIAKLIKNFTICE